MLIWFKFDGWIFKEGEGGLDSQLLGDVLDTVLNHSLLQFLLETDLFQLITLPAFIAVPAADTSVLNLGPHNLDSVHQLILASDVVDSIMKASYKIDAIILEHPPVTQLTPSQQTTIAKQAKLEKFKEIISSIPLVNGINKFARCHPNVFIKVIVHAPS